MMVWFWEKKRYRILKEGEVYLANDEWYAPYDDEWNPVNCVVGKKHGETFMPGTVVRRRLKKGE